jgi:hypothetical protein
MKLVPLFEMSAKYTESTFVGPLAGGEGMIWALRQGTVAGPRIRGSHRACNHPRRRADDVNVPDVHGVITTDDGALIYYEIHGYGVRDGAAGRRVTASSTYRTGAEKYAWLNTVIGAVEGHYLPDPEGGMVGRFRVYECINDLEA